ncbi:DNA-binding transcriptional LysR family regulator [Microbacterium resistens]|uniref:DNA-binding transcriptional LysR family regulator n=1 Tax=Microbacterium resistens TaxID=156977 RepID=A0ABU1S9C6_9MICO|nr:LysR family transcriptional regulator [Microbacterium resistens]MDR6866219.1 DNA-binding transcriptional LysR family regulator [Microbacterium resistens]
MNLEQLRGFVEVARTGSFTRAAADLHLAQPSLSRQISTLERELGSGLFHRARGNIALTAAGETLLPYARRMLADADAVRQEMDEIAGLRRGRVRLGAPPSLCASIVTEVLAAFRAAHPGIEIEITERGSRGLIAALGEGALDLALVTSSDDASAAPVSLARMALLTEELVVVSAASHPPLIGRGPLTLADVARLPQIAFPRSYDLRLTTDAAYADAGLVPSIVVEGPEMDAVLRFVERGVGVAVVPAMVSLGRDELRTTSLASPRLTRTVGLAHRADVRPTRAAAAMRETIVATADALAAAGAFVTRAD